MGFPLGVAGIDGSLERRWPLAIGLGLPDVSRYAAGRALLPPDAHEFVKKLPAAQYLGATKTLLGYGSPPERGDFHLVARK
jgi:hypothetical protein